MNKTDPGYSEASALDALLRQLVLEGGNDQFTQNLVDMNADFVFSGEASPATSRELALVSRLERGLIARRPMGRWWLNGIVLAVLLSLGTWWYVAGDSDTAASAPAPAPANREVPGTAISPGDGDTSRPVTQAVALILPADSSPQTDSVPQTDSLKTAKAPENKRWGHTNTHMPKPREYVYDSEYVTEVPGPVFSAKASPENFKVQKGIFTPVVSFGNTMCWTAQDSLAAVYYTGEPFKKGFRDMQYINFGEYAQRAQTEQAQENLRLQTTLYPWQMPWSVLEYADTNAIRVKQDTLPSGRKYAQLVVDNYPEKGVRIALQPFYFGKYEVTNKEYREFLAWVRASNGYANKPIASFETDTVFETDSSRIVHPARFGNANVAPVNAAGKRYYLVHRTIPTEDYKDVFNYIFFNTQNEAVRQTGKKNLYVMPDTAVWTTDFTFSFNEPMTNHYFYHPAYDDYPIVGVSWYQAMAFLDWKTHMHQKQLDAEGVPYTIEYLLPSDIEWELATISFELGSSRAYNPYYGCTADWMTNLGISHPGHDDPYQRPNYLKNLFTKDQYFRGDYIADGAFHTAPVTRLFEGHEDPLGFAWLDGNVSEWMMETYAENWSPFFRKHLLVLDADNSESSLLAKQIELLYDKGNARNGRLVRGANWYDERFGRRPRADRNEAGLSPKRFLDPSEQHSTVGFRYVVHVKYKDEAQRLP